MSRQNKRLKNASFPANIYLSTIETLEKGMKYV